MCAVLWLVGPLLCAATCISDRLGHDRVCAVQASPDDHHCIVTAHDHEQSHGAAKAHAQDDGEAQPQHNSNGKNGCAERFCCSTMQALVPTAQPILIANSISYQVFVVCLLNAAGEHTLAASNCEPVRQANPHDWVFTPEVCLGPAHRPLAPPSPEVG